MMQYRSNRALKLCKIVLSLFNNLLSVLAINVYATLITCMREFYYIKLPFDKEQQIEEKTLNGDLSGYRIFIAVG